MFAFFFFGIFIASSCFGFIVCIFINIIDSIENPYEIGCNYF